MPPNTILLSQMMRELHATPGFTDTLLAQLNRDGKQGPALLTPALVTRMRELILGKDWQGLDRFPGWTMAAITPTVRVIAKTVGNGNATRGELTRWIDLGPYAVDRAETVRLDTPSTLPGFTTEGIVSELTVAEGAGVIRGDGPNPALAPMHAESQRLADVLNRLSLNRMEQAADFTAVIGGQKASTPQALIDALTATGHTVAVYDARYFANFGHFHYRRSGATEEVMMPFWIDTQIAIPGSKRSLLVPVSHAEYEWQVRGPRINAAVSYYFGIDGKAEFRTMDTLDQAWVLGRRAHQYRGADATEVTRLTGLMVSAYLGEHLRHPELPFGGYFTLGVCQDSIAAIEKKMTGKETLFPNTTDPRFFNDATDAQDGEANALIEAITKDRSGEPPDPERVFGSIPANDLREITIPGLAQDLAAVHEAWQNGALTRTPSWIHSTRRMTLRVLAAATVLLLLGFVLMLFRRALFAS